MKITFLEVNHGLKIQCTLNGQALWQPQRDDTQAISRKQASKKGRGRD